MKIGIDLRFISDELYSKFAIELVNSIINNNLEKKYILYLNNDINIINYSNVEKKIINIENGSFSEQFKFLKILKEDKNNSMIFFNQYKPIFYRGDYITIIGSLKEIYYMNFNSRIKKIKFLFLMENNLNHARNTICLDKNTKNELIEKYNIKEEKIKIINGFFPKNETKREENHVEVNIKNKFLIKNDFIIYSGGDSIEKNYEKLILVLDKLKKDEIEIDLIFLGNNIAKNITLRNHIIDLKLEKNVFFLGSPDIETKKYLYKEALFTIFPSFYETFPFRLAEPVYFGTNILSSNLKNIRKIFGEKITYFSPISVNSIYKVVKDFIINNKKGEYIDYSDIKQKYSLEKTSNQLLEIIE